MSKKELQINMRAELDTLRIINDDQQQHNQMQMEGFAGENQELV